MKISKDQISRMIGMIMNTKQQEISCDDVHNFLDQYTEKAIAGEDVSAILPFVHSHLKMCPDCYEEYNALRRILESQQEKTLGIS